MPTKLKILIAPLDWGIGHATRIIPIISNLLENGCEVVIAAEGLTFSLLKQEFPEVEFILFKGYRITYSKQKKWLPLKIFIQIPNLLLSILIEHKWLKKVVKDYSIDAVISDNRFGLFHANIPCIYITHQLMIKTGDGVTEKFIRKIHNRFIKKFTACWVPDFEGTSNIAGDLSHPTPPLPSNTRYIGCLSRFNRSVANGKKFDLLILLSGPEPQRTIFENLLLSQLKLYSGTVLFVRGLPGINETQKDEIGESIILKNHLNAVELNAAINNCGMVISRSGYTTVMDLIKLQQKAILVPTPGQTEQEYLANHLMKNNLFFCAQQQHFCLQDALKKASDFDFRYLKEDMNEYKKIVKNFILDLSRNIKSKT